MSNNDNDKPSQVNIDTDGVAEAVGTDIDVEAVLDGEDIKEFGGRGGPPPNGQVMARDLYIPYGFQTM
eukprot:5334085-Karenia_brevis.AAC.1